MNNYQPFSNFAQQVMSPQQYQYPNNYPLAQEGGLLNGYVRQEQLGGTQMDGIVEEPQQL